MKEKKIAVGAMVCLVVLALVITIVVLVVKQGNTTTTIPETPTTGTENKVEEKKEENKNTESNANIKLTNTYKVPMKNIYIDTPSYQEIEEGYTELFIVHEQKYVAITSNRKVNAIDSKQAYEITFDKFKTNMTNYEGGVNSIYIEREENKQVNGIDVHYFEGKINYGTATKYDGYAIGYSFVIDGVPCSIIGSVINEQKQSNINEIKTVVNEMIKTVRTSE